MSRLTQLMTGIACAAAIGAMIEPIAHAAQVTLNVWTIDFQNQYMFPLAKEFEKLHSAITVNVKHVQFQDRNNDLARAAITGDVPDVSYIDNRYIDLFGSRGLLRNLAPMTAQSKVIDLSKFYPGPLAAVKYGDAIYGIPRGAVGNCRARHETPSSITASPCSRR